MRLVLALALEDSRFVLVRNAARKGWELPGGAAEEGEGDEETAIREFREEVGRDFFPRGKVKMPHFVVCVGRMGEPIGKGEMEWRLFDSLPPDLAFPRGEYEVLLRRALEDAE